MPGCQRLVAARAMADRHAGPRHPGHLVRVEMNAVRQPHPFVQPAAVFQIVDRPAAMTSPGRNLFSSSVSPRCVCSRHIGTGGEFSGLTHQRRCHRERRTRRQRDLHHRRRACCRDGARSAVRNRPGSCPRPAPRCRAAGRRHAATGFIEPRVSTTRRPRRARRRDLDIDRLIEARRKHIMMIGAGGAARQHQLGHRHRRGKIERLRASACAHTRVAALATTETVQRVERRRHRAGQRLVEMVMGIDQRPAARHAAEASNTAVTSAPLRRPSTHA